MISKHSSLLFLQETISAKLTVVPSLICRVISAISGIPMECFAPKETLVVDKIFPSSPFRTYL